VGTQRSAREGPPDAFLYRVSVADVASPGPFSRFAGFERVITLLEGRGFVLRFADGREVSVTRPFEPFEFSGDDSVDCALLEGPVRDLNVMVGRERASLAVERLSAHGNVRVALDGATLLVFVLSGTLETTHGSAARHALIVSEDDLEAHADLPAELFVARIRARVSPR